jgi:hypothetical protein
MDVTSKLDLAREAIARARADDEDRHETMLKLLLDLTYPEARDGTRVDVSAFKAILAYHLVRCGWRMDPTKRMIKSRKVTARGVAADAIDWVPINAPDDPLDNLANMTMAEIDALPPGLKAEAMQRLTGEVLPELPENPGWHVQTSIRIEDDPTEPDDGFEWTGNRSEIEH